MATNEKKKMSMLTMVLIGAGVILALGMGSCRSTRQDRPDEPPIDVGDGSITFEYAGGITAIGQEVEAKHWWKKVRSFTLLANGAPIGPPVPVEKDRRDWELTSSSTPGFKLSRKDHLFGDSVTGHCPGPDWVVSGTKATCNPPGNTQLTPAKLTFKNGDPPVDFVCPPKQMCKLRLEFK